MNRDEFEETCRQCVDFMKEYLGGGKVELRTFYDVGFKMIRAAVHIDVPDDGPPMDNRICIFRLAEALIEASYLEYMLSLKFGETASGDDFVELSRAKIREYFDENYFKDNVFIETNSFPNLWHGLDFCIEFLKMAPTVDFSQSDKSHVAIALASDIVKVSGMVIWSAALSHERGIELPYTHRLLREVYTLKYGVVMCDYDQNKVSEICREILPLVEDLRETTVGGRTREVNVLN